MPETWYNLYLQQNVFLYLSLAHTMQLDINNAKKLTSDFSELCQKGRSVVGHYCHSVQTRD
jgi:hypothetical protein